MSSKKKIKLRVPGRINLIGEHVDYNGGLVMPMAINKYFDIVARPRDDNLFEVNSRVLNDSIYFDLNDLPQGSSKSWANYIIGVAANIKAKFPDLRGITMIIAGNLQLASGLSSSAALEVSFAVALLKANNIYLDSFSLAKLCQKAEHDYVGVKCGLMDQIAVIMGQKDRVVYFDTLHNNVEYVLFPQGYAIAAIHSGQTRELSSSAYNDRRKECAEALSLLVQIAGINSFREASLKHLWQASPSMSSVLYRRALHVIKEIQRTKKAAVALEYGNMELVGRLLNNSHQSLSDLYETSTSSIDAQVEQIQSLPGVLGARLCGAGFGGYIIALVETRYQRKFNLAIQSLIREGFLPGEIFITRPQEGAIRYL